MRKVTEGKTVKITSGVTLLKEKRYKTTREKYKEVEKVENSRKEQKGGGERAGLIGADEITGRRLKR